MHAILLVLLSAAPGTSASEVPQLQVAAPGLSAAGFDDETEAFLSEHLAQKLKEAGAKVITGREITTLLGLEREKMMLGGCDENQASCAAELANALGSDVVLMGDVARLDTSIQVNVRLISAVSASTIASQSARASTLEGVVDELSRAAYALAEEAAQNLKRSLSPRKSLTTASPQQTASSFPRWLPGAIGLAGGLFGAVAYTQADSRFAALKQTALIEEVQRFRDEGKTWQTLTWTGFGLAAAGLATSAALYAFTGESPNVTAAATPEGAGLFISGVIP